MRLESVWFEVPGAKAWPAVWYERHAQVLAYSAAKNSPGWAINVRKIGPPTPRRCARGGSSASSYIYNTHKLEEWRRIIDGAQDDERVLLIDADTMVLRPLDPAWERPFDVAITVKRGITRLPLNGGVVFVRVNARSRAFMAAWWEWNLRLLGDAALHARWWRTYAGMNQAALGALLENGGPRMATVCELRCEEWNLETATWDTYSAARPPRIVHIKSGLRRGVMSPKHAASLQQPARRLLAEAWWQLEREAQVPA